MKRLMDLAKADVPANEHLGIRIDGETKAQIEQLRESYGKKVVANWLRTMIRQAVRAEQAGVKQPA